VTCLDIVGAVIGSAAEGAATTGRAASRPGSGAEVNDGRVGSDGADGSGRGNPSDGIAQACLSPVCGVSFGAALVDTGLVFVELADAEARVAADIVVGGAVAAGTSPREDSPGEAADRWTVVVVAAGAVDCVVSPDRIHGASARCTMPGIAGFLVATGNSAAVDIGCGTVGLASPCTCPLGPSGSTVCPSGARKLGFCAVASDEVNRSSGAIGGVAVTTRCSGGNSCHAARCTGGAAATPTFVDGAC
jgi:hypothetical protein